jgi:hypothetical protein
MGVTGMKQKRNHRAASIPLLAAAVVLSVSAAQVPKSEKEIPVFPGAVRSAAAEAELKQQSEGVENTGLRSAVLKVYKTNAPPEEIFAFYLQAMGGREGISDEDPMALAPGTVSPVFHEIETYGESDLTDDIYEGHKYPGAWVKQNLIKNRRPYKPGMWIKVVRFSWEKKEANGDLTRFYVAIEDNSFEFDPEKYLTASQIRVDAATDKSQQAMREETDESMDREIEGMAASMKSKPPSEKDLGVPIYPGAGFDAENSAGMSAGNTYAMYLYLTADPPSKVAAFYGQRLSVRPVPVGDGQYMIPLKGQMPLPEEGISIQPNTMFGGTAKTVITIQKTAAGRD